MISLLRHRKLKKHILEMQSSDSVDSEPDLEVLVTIIITSNDKILYFSTNIQNARLNIS